jgi:two-component system, chemotaxis family, chemotaxis protein CheY
MVARIMVVDDLPLMRMRIRESLLVEGHEVVEATEGGDAMEQYRRKRPDAVFMDVRMPDMNGVDALKQMREIDPTARVTLLTGDAQREIVEEAKLAGAVDFILKPFNHQRLIDAVHKMLS